MSDEITITREEANFIRTILAPKLNSSHLVEALYEKLEPPIPFWKKAHKKLSELGKDHNHLFSNFLVELEYSKPANLYTIKGLINRNYNLCYFSGEELLIISKLYSYLKENE